MPFHAIVNGHTTSRITLDAIICNVLVAISPNTRGPFIRTITHPLARGGDGASTIVKMAKADTKTKSSTSTQKRTTKSKKDPAAPKRPLSAYMFFSQDHRERVKQANSDAGFGDIGRLLGAKWKEMSEAEKKPYNDMATRDKARAEAEKAAYNKRR